MPRIKRSVTGLLTGVGLAVLAGAASAQTYATIGATPNRQAIGAALDTATGPDANLASLRTALAAGTTAQANVGLGQLTPGSYATLTEIGRIGNDNDQRVISNHLSLLRSGEVSPTGMFTEGALNVARYPARADQPGGQIDLTSLTLGGDAVIGPLIIGGSLTYRDASAKLDRQLSQGDLTGYSSNLFMTTRFGDGMFLDGMVGAGKGDLDLRRSANIGALTTSQTASTTLRTYNAGLRLGKTIDLGGAQLEPFIGARYGETRVKGFSESGGAAALVVGGHTQDTLQSDLGARVTGSFVAAGATMRPELRAAWVHEFKDDAVAFDYALHAAGPTIVRYSTSPLLNKDMAQVGLGMSVNGIGGGVFRVDYDGKFGKGHAQQQAFSMGARFPF